MAEEDWESVTKIGSRVRGGGGEPKEKVLRGDSAVNAARRTGAAITTEKKFGGANTVRTTPPAGSGGGRTRLPPTPSPSP
jgi:putative transcription factor